MHAAGRTWVSSLFMVFSLRPPTKPGYHDVTMHALFLVKERMVPRLVKGVDRKEVKFGQTADVHKTDEIRDSCKCRAFVFATAVQCVHQQSV